eukprot:TRINITY_DN7400_c0_g1_i1.p1 TRINITY_DN7400_c0_g1~~TRINITY_DN7400_c0_g1_i1.p1  ORF type:complete len:404 (-),score=79.54 TRINITY_DN7400_c0_g1_i1:257-1468(-)
MNALLITLSFLGATAVHGFVPAGAVRNVQWHSVCSSSQLQPEGLLLRAATTGDNQDPSQLKELVDAVNGLRDDVRSFRTMIDAKVEQSKRLEELVKERGELIDTMLLSQEEIGRDILEFNRNLDGLIEVKARGYAGQQQYVQPSARSVFARSIQDLGRLVPRDIIKSGHGRPGSPAALIIQAAVRLVEERVPERLLRCIHAKLQSDDVAELPWFNSDGSVNQNGLDKFIGTCKDKALCRHLRQLQDVLLLNFNKEDRVQELVGSGSGVMCLLAAAHAPQFLSEDDRTHVVPADALEFDLTRHTVDAVIMSSDRRLAIDIAIGEASAALPPVGEAVRQLGLSLGAFKWLITMCRPDPKPEAVLVGRLCISWASLIKHDRKDFEDQCKLAEAAWGYRLALEPYRV